MNKFIKSVAKYATGTKLIIECVNGGKLLGEIDTMYETDNGLEVDEEGYKEYFAVALKILSILNYSFKKKNKHIKIGNLIEISDQGDIKTIWTEDEKVIWELED